MHTNMEPYGCRPAPTSYSNLSCIHVLMIGTLAHLMRASSYDTQLPCEHIHTLLLIELHEAPAHLSLGPRNSRPVR